MFSLPLNINLDPDEAEMRLALGGRGGGVGGVRQKKTPCKVLLVLAIKEI